MAKALYRKYLMAAPAGALISTFPAQLQCQLYYCGESSPAPAFSSRQRRSALSLWQLSLALAKAYRESYRLGSLEISAGETSA